MKKIINTPTTERVNTAKAAGFPGFDDVYGNPPYKHKLHLKILENTRSVCASSGIMTAIHPVRFMSDPLASYRESSDLKKFYGLFSSCSNCEMMSTTAAGVIFKMPFEYNLGINTYEPRSFESVIDPKETNLLIESGLRKIVECIHSKGMLSFEDLCKDNSPSLDGYYRVIVRNIPRGPLKSPYNQNNYIVVEDRILRPGEKYVNRTGEIIKRKVIIFATEEECRNFIAVYKSALMVGYQQKIGTNRHAPLDFTPAFNGDFTKSWSQEAMAQFLGLNSDEAKQIEWSPNYTNSLLSITGDKNTGINCSNFNSINAIKMHNSAASSMVTTDKKKKSGKKFSATEYRKKACENIDELHQLQAYTEEEVLSVLIPLLKEVDEKELTQEEAISYVKRKLNAKFKQQERRFHTVSPEVKEEPNEVSIQVEEVAEGNTEPKENKVDQSKNKERIINTVIKPTADATFPGILGWNRNVDVVMVYYGPLAWILVSKRLSLCALVAKLEVRGPPLLGKHA